ncbi:cytochrome P450 [Fusarium albosuccineum]|uniref:Cytochrome P450 n=1 Tax=Fusarium albosuccineum TaxID=1237068 RepID=A0A8H4P082_9HYPO|nr:cytochrome P450 [Fusarium albosuccineum]
MFATLRKVDHAKRKRIFANRYANSNVSRGSAIAGIQERSRRFIERCTSNGSAAHDIFCEGTHLDVNLNIDRLVSFYAPRLHSLASGILRLWLKPRETPLLEQYVLQAVEQAKAEPFTLLSRLHEKSADINFTDTAAECLDHINAGIDTTGDLLCFLIWELSQPRSVDIQQKLHKELRLNPNTPLDQLPYLGAVVYEGLRCFPPIAMSLPRRVPPGGRHIDDTWLPADTIVSCQAYSVHWLHPSVFPAPEEYDPSQWLETEGDADRRKLMFAFSSGGRGCIGKHLALVEMKTLLRDVYSAYSTTPHMSMTEESMTMSDQLLSETRNA